MTWLDALILGVLQGITEFLPISSSGHLVLGEEYLGLHVESLKIFDVFMHFASLLAILLYFRKDVLELLKSFFGLFAGKYSKKDPFLKLILFIIVGTIPVVIFAPLLEDKVDLIFRNVEYISICMIIVGIVFIIGEFTYKRVHREASIAEKVTEKADDAMEILQADYVSKEVRGLTMRKALVIGFAQLIAIIPGVSRSGSTIVAGLFQGISRDAAARFSFLLSIPAILGAVVLKSMDLNGSADLGVGLVPLAVGFVSTFLFGLAAVYFLMRFLKKHSLIVFSVYLIALGLGIFI